MRRNELVEYLDKYLRLAEIKDYGPQGLQVDSGKEDIQRIALAVDVAPPIITAAAGWQADMLLVHHGILWRSVERIAGPLGERVRRLITSEIDLYAAHLALDAHPEVGNNAVLGSMFGLQQIDWWAALNGTPLGVVGDIQPRDRASFVGEVNRLLNTNARVLAHGPKIIKRVAILSGFGADQVAGAQEQGADTYLTGETSHAQYWQAADLGMNVLFAGHYATETIGVRALGAHLADKFNLSTRFFDFPTEM